jgi:hypothetical protein
MAHEALSLFSQTLLQQRISLSCVSFTEHARINSQLSTLFKEMA